MSLTSAATVLASGPALLSGDAAKPETPAARLFTPRLLLLGLLVIAAMICEGGTADWSGIYLRNGRGLGAGWVGVGFGVFSIIMLLGRLSGDFLTGLLGELRILRWGGLLSSAGAVLVVFGPGTDASLLGFALFGAGLANASPILYRAAGLMPDLPAGAGLATSVGMGYAGLLAGPPLLGGVAQAYGLRTIFLVLSILALLLTAGARLGGSLSKSDRPPSERPANM